MLSMTSLAIEHEIAYRRHALERAARRDAVVRYRNQRRARRQGTTASPHLSWWRRFALSH